MIRIAATADVHFGDDSAGTLRPHLEHLPERADMLVLAGDLTRHGDPGEAAVLAEELSGLPVPMVAVLGNHDYHSDHGAEVAKVLEAAGVSVLEGTTTVVEASGASPAPRASAGVSPGRAGVSSENPR